MGTRVERWSFRGGTERTQFETLRRYLQQQRSSRRLEVGREDVFQPPAGGVLLGPSGLPATHLAGVRHAYGAVHCEDHRLERVAAVVRLHGVRAERLTTGLVAIVGDAGRDGVAHAERLERRMVLDGGPVGLWDVHGLRRILRGGADVDMLRLAVVGFDLAEEA